MDGSREFPRPTSTCLPCEKQSGKKKNFKQWFTIIHLKFEFQMETVDHISWTPSSSSGEGCKAIVLSGNMLALHDVNVVKGIDDERLDFSKLHKVFHDIQL